MTARRWWLAVTGTLLIALVAGAVDWVAFPTVNRPGSPDVIELLGSAYRPGEIVTGRQLAARSPDATVLVSNPTGTCPTVVTGQVCFVPDPSTTEGEARFGAEWARAHHAGSVVVVAPTYQVSRARLWFRRCWPGGLAVVNAATSLGRRLQQVPYQVAGWVKAEVFERRC